MGVGGIPIGAQQFAAVSSSSQLPTLSSGIPRTGQPREAVLRVSASLQDFSNVHRNGASSAGVVRSSSTVNGFGLTVPSQQVARSESGPPVLTTIKSNLVRRPSGSVNVQFGYSAICWSKGGAILGSVALVLALLYLGFVWAGFNFAPDNLEYAIVIDCGSTGTRIHVYGWTHEMDVGKDSLPVMVLPLPPVHPGAQKNDGAPSFDKGKKQGEGRAYKRMETEPGMDKLLHNESGVKVAIQPLIDWAANQIPRSAHGKTQLFFMATAGLRKLSPTDSGWLLDKAWSVLKRSPFICRREWVRIITGQEEAYYGWIALNYNRDRLGYASKQSSFGALDLGGSSLEVTFEPHEIPRAEYGVNVTIGSGEHHLYAYSHPGFGLNDAFEKSVALLIQRGAYKRRAGTIHVQHPCLNQGYKKPFVCSSRCVLPPFPHVNEPHKGQRSMLAGEEYAGKIELIGKANWASCRSLAQSVINVSGLADGRECEFPPCALGKHQPQPQGQFYALAGFFVVYKFFGLTSRHSLDDLLQKGQEFCNLKWTAAQESVVFQPSIDRYCFRAPYVVALLREGLHLGDDQIVIGSGDFAWTLGAALNEAGALLPATLKGGDKYSGLIRFRQSVFIQDVHSLTFLVLLFFLFMFALITCYRRIPPRSWRRPDLPLFVPPSVSGGPFSSWFPPSFLSQVRLGGSTSGTSSLSGEGRVKQPHSPAPSASNNSFHHQMFGSGAMLAGGDGPVLECDALQPSMAPGVINSGGRPQIQLATLKMHNKGVSKLQSRRTQSREDLSAYMADNPHIPKRGPLPLLLLPMLQSRGRRRATPIRYGHGRTSLRHISSSPMIMPQQGGTQVVSSQDGPPLASNPGEQDPGGTPDWAQRMEDQLHETLVGLFNDVGVATLL